MQKHLLWRTPSPSHAIRDAGDELPIDQDFFHRSMLEISTRRGAWWSCHRCLTGAFGFGMRSGKTLVPVCRSHACTRSPAERLVGATRRVVSPVRWSVEATAVRAAQVRHANAAVWTDGDGRWLWSTARRTPEGEDRDTIRWEAWKADRCWCLCLAIRVSRMEISATGEIFQQSGKCFLFFRREHRTKIRTAGSQFSIVYGDLNPAYYFFIKNNIRSKL